MRTIDVWWACVLGFASAILLSLAAHAQTYSVLYAFKGGSSGANPASAMIMDKSGNLYGNTQYGGGGGCGGNGGCGTLFKLAPDGTETVLYAFTGGKDGAAPFAAALTENAKGDLYGTAFDGGVNGCFYDQGCGSDFKLAPDGRFALLHKFAGGNDGANPETQLLRGSTHGSYYGTTLDGDGTGCYQGWGCGTVYQLARSRTETILYAFKGGNDGESPAGNLIADAAGNLYGTTAEGGDPNCALYLGCGTIFKLAPDGTETVLHAFSFDDGASPGAGVIRDSQGNLYGTADLGGGGCYQVDEGCGTLFKLAPDGTLSVLHNFTGGTDGGLPDGGLAADAKGSLYGTTQIGGDFNCDCGIVFKLAPSGTFAVLHTFTAGTDGAQPYAGLLKGSDGYLYGTTYYGGGGSCGVFGNGCGTVFRIKK